jgi:signal transduction histidine kinase
MVTLSKRDPTRAAVAEIAPRSRSLRLRLMTLAAVSIAVTLTIAGLSLAYIFENHIERLIEQDLEIRWLELANAFALKADQPILSRELSDARYQRPGSGAYWRVTDGGVARLRSRSLWDQDIEPTDFVDLTPTGKAVEQRGPNGSTVYMMEREVTLNGDAGPRMFRLAVALDASPVSALRQSFTIQVVLALILIGLVLFGGAWLQASFGLRPLKLLRNELALVNRGGKTNLAGHFPEEVAPLVEDLNRLLARQEDLIRKARDRAGDLAHGLKTSLTILQGEARRSESKGELNTANLLREQIALMRHHIDRELSRARTFGATAAGGTLTDVKKTVDRLIDIIRRMPRGELIVWENRTPEGLRLRMDSDDFGETVGNLIDNARKWAKSSVRVSALTSQKDVSIIVDDDGPGVPLEARALILRRGERATAGGEGAGLGLAISMDILAQYDTALTIEDAPAGGCRVRFAVTGWIDDDRQRAG